MVAAEATIRRAATATIIRPAGVYTATPPPPPGMLMRRVRAGEGGPRGMLYGNRIHRDDSSAVGGALLEARRLRGTGASNVARRR